MVKMGEGNAWNLEKWEVLDGLEGVSHEIGTREGRGIGDGRLGGDLDLPRRREGRGGTRRKNEMGLVSDEC
jgi:hypothetical protein